MSKNRGSDSQTDSRANGLANGKIGIGKTGAKKIDDHAVSSASAKFTGKFTGTATYIATEDLQIAVNAAMVLERPLLIKGCLLYTSPSPRDS